MAEITRLFAGAALILMAAALVITLVVNVPIEGQMIVKQLGGLAGEQQGLDRFNLVTIDAVSHV